MVTKALIIAAGQGSRLKRDENDIPKPLRKVAGLPLLKRIILTAKKAGISEFVIVVGHQKEMIIEAVQSYDLGVKVEFVENPEWHKSNGLSVLAAKKYLRENFILLMSDHIFKPKSLRELRNMSLNGNEVLLAVDYRLSNIFDKDDATKVNVEKGQIVSIDKSLSNFNAVDTGMFLATPELFHALEAARVKGDCSLSDGIRLLATHGQAGTFDIGDAYWQDVDTIPALRHAEQILLNECRKATDGFISRHLNRRISLWITKYVIRTNMSAHHMTGITTLVGISSGIFVARGEYWNILLGAFLFQLASILDGVDGEMSRIKFTASKVGQWLDTISDNIAYLSFVVGLVAGTARFGTTATQLIGVLTLIGLGLTMLVLFSYLQRFTNSGSMLAIQKDFLGTASQHPVKMFLKKIQFAIKRDFFALLFLVLAIANQAQVILWLCFIGTNITWLALLNHRLGLFKSPVAGKEIPDSTAQ